MAETHTLSALKRKRAVIAGELLRAERRCEAMRKHLDALDQTLRIFGYEGEPADIEPVHRRRRVFGRGEVQRYVLDILRTSDEPMTNGEIADRIMTERAMDQDNRNLRRTRVERVAAVQR